jgi:hypothetical protein
MHKSNCTLITDDHRNDDGIVSLCLYILAIITHCIIYIGPLVLNFVSTERAKTALQGDTYFMGMVALVWCLKCCGFHGYATTARF